MTHLPDSDLRELEGLLASATPGPWEQVQTGVYADDIQVAYAVFHEADNAANAALIVAAVNALPSLIADLRAARAEIERLKANG